MTIYDLKPKFQALLRPIVEALAQKGVTPNQVTLAALALSAGAGCAVALAPASAWALLSIPIVLFVRMALNAIDGMLAREHDMRSELGAVLNELGDLLSDAFLYLPFALIPGVSPLWAVLFVFVGILTETAGILAQALGRDRRYDGPMGKSDRAFLMGLIALLLGAGVAPGLWSTLLLAAGTLLGVRTVYNRAAGGIA